MSRREGASEFSKRGHSGYLSACRACTAAASRAWRAANPERAKAIADAWKAANHERVNVRAVAWRAANHERAKATDAAWEAANPLSVTLRGMVQRCTNPAKPVYKNYGGRGISVCDRWLGKGGLSNFVADVGERPSPKHSLDRIDVDGNYEPSNCRWATRAEQEANKRPKVFVSAARAAVVELFGPAAGVRFAAHLVTV